MPKALVRARGVATPDQFKTDWSQFMKNNIAMNLLLYPLTVTLVKSDDQLSFLPALTKAMVDKEIPDQNVYIAVYLKNDDNQIIAAVNNSKVASFTEAEDIGGVDFLKLDGPLLFPMSGTKLTAAKKYDLHVIFSDKEITTEIAENANDFPFVLYGPASEYVIEVTCHA